MECNICNLPQEIFSVTRCGHNDICFLCSIKLRSLTNNFKCPLCNIISVEVIFTNNHDAAFEDFNEAELISYKDGILFDGQATQTEVEKFQQIRCPVPNCTDNTVYATQENLKKHLKDKHNRFFCDLCLKNRTLVFKEQKLYTSAQLERHLKKGDLDDEGSVTFFHPFCKFCYEYVYDEESLQKHLTQNHFSCHLCGDDQKYVFYKEYKNLEIHFNMSHYLCPDKECRDKCFVVFKIPAELEHHNLKNHNKEFSADKSAKNINQNLLMSMTNFSYGENDKFKRKKETKSFIKDREGVDFEPQFLSKRAIRSKYYTEKEVTPNEKLDIRDYYQQYAIKEFEIEAVLEVEKQLKNAVFIEDTDNQGRYRSKRGKKGGNHDGGVSQVFVPKNKEEVQMYLEDCNMAHYQALAVTSDEFDRALRNSLAENEYKNMRYSTKDYYEGKINEYQLFDAFVKYVGEKQAFKIFPFFITTIENEVTVKVLDEFFYNAMLKLPRRVDSFIVSVKTYGELFQTLQKELEKQVISRIRDKKLDIKGKSYIMDPARLFQLNKIVARLQNNDMAQFKFSKQFGISGDTHLTLVTLLTADRNLVQDILAKIPENEMLILYKYVELCEDRLLNKNSYTDVNKVPKNLLHKIFELHSDIKYMFKKVIGEEAFEKLNHLGPETTSTKPKQDPTPMESNPIKKTTSKKDEDKFKDREERKVNAPKEQVSTTTSTAKDPEFDAKNKYEFPELKSQAKKKEVKTLNSNWAKQNINPFGYKDIKEPENVVKKKIESEFPTLIRGDNTVKPIWAQKDNEWANTKSKSKKEEQVEEEDLGIMGYGKEDYQLERMIVKEKKNKKGDSTLFLSGGFK